jgi:HlyD family secretion protein
MMMKNHKRLVILGVILVLIFLCVGMFWGTNTKIVPGYVSTNIRYISSDEGGQIVSMNANEGETVNQDQVLFSLDSAKNKTLLQSNEYLHAAAMHNEDNLSKGKRTPYIEKTKSDMIAADANLTVAYEEYVRQKELLKHDSTSEKQYQQAYSKYIQAQQQLKSLELMQFINKLPARDENLETAKSIAQAVGNNSKYIKDKISSASVKSLEDSYVYQVFFRKGEMVRPYTPVMTLINPNDVYIVFYLSKEDLSRVHIGQKINFSTSLKNNVSGVINYISQKSEYTPPLLYGLNSDSEISFEIRAKVKYSKDDSGIHIGEPVRVTLK